MYGDTDVMRKHAGRLREQGVEIRALADRLVAQTESARAGPAAPRDAMRERIRERATRLREVADRHDGAADTLDEPHLQVVDELKDAIAEAERRAAALLDDGARRVRAARAGPQGLAGGHPARSAGIGRLMATIDLGPPRPTPHDLLDGLPRRVALTLPELRFAADAGRRRPAPLRPARRRRRRRRPRRPARPQPRLAPSRRRTPRRSPACTTRPRRCPGADCWWRPRRRRRRRGPARRGRAAGHARRSPSTSTSPPGRVPGQVVAPAERRRGRRAVDARTGWSSSWPGSRPGPGRPSWPASPSCPRTCRCTTSVVPDLVDLPSRAGRRRDRGGPHPPHRPASPCWWSSIPAAVTDGAGRTLTDGEVVRAAHRAGHRGARPAARAGRGRVRRTRPARSAWWRGRWSPTGGARSVRTTTTTGSRLEVARVIPEDLAAELAPVLAEVSP